MTSQYKTPSTPRVISPSPTPSDQSNKDGYFPPVTRSKVTSTRKSSVPPIQEHTKSSTTQDDPALDRARPRSRRVEVAQETNMNGASPANAKANVASAPSSRPVRRRYIGNDTRPSSGDHKDLLSPNTANKQGGLGSSYWRNLSRSPSPLGLIPIHRDFRAFIHKHEVPRKVLHVSIGFVTLFLYQQGVQTSQIHPVLISLLIPIFTVDVIRFNWPAFNDVYIKVMGAFMRESEAHDRFNGVISYLAGLWATMYFCKKDVAVMSVLLLSWCDTAASTFGRLLGKYTPRVRRGKSLAGSLACFVFGVASAALFWGYIAPRTDSALNQGVNSFAFDGTLTLPAQARDAFGLTIEQSAVSGSTALVVLSLASGLIASLSEAIDVFGLDDNLTIPIFTGLGLGVFLHIFGSG